ncbi:DNA methyltransferase, partial [Acinetobacter baumannii]|nr:site-specific DNA-methyltransferase [Acinetobacter baumannii]EKU0560667.1 site-specific DNA-methyltransferase [Acinetobacter baumannii]EKU2507226.1 site-specific DNA-methyltransferase [Acinetobacter baumannii]EKW2951103.1 site-specific DNA-methyltransferase [Acinetobacter baumannii]EKW7199090.1 site-specific DNA-methyltransferase [Acinetobacter baumannii]
FYQDGRTATLQVEKLLDKGVFQFPKNTDVLAKLIDLVTKENDIVLDFFAGSGSTAHACLNLNLQDNKARRFIMVQLPELLSEDVKEQKAAYKYCLKNGLAPNIAEISKARIKQVIGSIKSEVSLDKGLKVFKLASSNLKAWNPNVLDLEDSLDLNENHLIEGRTELDVLYELLLKRGIDLTTPIENREVNAKTLYSIGHGAVFACLDDSILASDLDVISSAIIEWHKELAPSNETHIFFKDSAFQDDVVKTNLAAILEQNGLKHVRSL